MKKIFLLLMIFVLAVALIACGSETDPQTTETDPALTEAPESEVTEPVETEHVHNVEVEETAATCIEYGYKKETCSLCGEVVFETAYPRAPHAPSGPVTCENDSVCTVCGKVLETATGHVFEEVTEYVPATCTSEGSETGVCSVCGETKTVVLPKEHVVVNLGDPSALTFVDGKIQASCSKCQQVVDVTGDVRLQLNFDKSTVQDEVDALATDENGLAYGAIYESNQSDKKEPLVEKGVLNLVGNKSAGISFNAAMLKDAKCYVISFDWCVNNSGGQMTIGVAGLANDELFGAHTEDEYDYALYVERSTGSVYKGDKKAGSIAGCKITSTWQHVDIVVNNATGNNYVYIDGEFFAANETGNWKVEGDGQYTLRLGGQFNTHKPHFDNFEISVVR